VRTPHPLIASCGFAALAACGNVQSQAPSDAPVISDAAADAWASNCVPMALVTKVETADAGFANACIHGEWFLQAFNGITSPVTDGKPEDITPVVPTPITIGSSPLDPTSTFAVHVTGSGQQNVGTSPSFAQLTVSLNTPSASLLGSVDVTAYTGVQFYAIVNTGATGARLTVRDLYTDPIGGRCNPASGQPTSCFDDPGAQLTITTTWTKYQIPFASLVQIGFGNPSPVGADFPKNAITHIKWDIGIPMSGPTAAWELWVDDLTFY
jgi:hypothetical protein